MVKYRPGISFFKYVVLGLILGVTHDGSTQEGETKISFGEFVGWTFENNRRKCHAFTSNIVPSA